MPIVYQYEYPQVGWITTDLDGIVEEFRNEVEANNLFAGEIDFKVRVVEMTQEEIDAMPEADL